MSISRFLSEVGAFSVRRPWVVLGLALLAAVLSLGYAATSLALKTSNLDLIDPDLGPVRDFRVFAEEFGTPNVLVVVFEGEEEARLREAVDRAGELLRGIPAVRSVADRLPFDDQTLADLGVEPYLTSVDRGMFFVFVQPDDPHSSAQTIEPFVNEVRQTLDHAGIQQLGVRVGLTGVPAYALDDAQIIRRDISRLSLVSVVLVLFLFVTAFGSLRRPVLAVIALLFAVATVLGVLTFYPGHLTLLSAFFASILFGLGIDYGIHIVGRVEELVAEGLSEEQAVPQALASLSRGLVTGTLTTALVFLSMLFCGFRGFEELGLIAGLGVVICLTAMVTVLPALLVVFGSRKVIRRHPASGRLGKSLIALQSRWVAGGLAIAALVALVASIGGRPGFDTDYLNLQPADSEAARLEREMVRRSDLSPNFAVFVADSMDEVQEISDRLLEDETVGEVYSKADLELLGVDAPQGAGSSFLGGLESSAGRYAVFAYPDDDVWNPQKQQEFIDHMQAIDPRVTGMPILGNFMVDRSKRALYVTAVLGSVLLLVCLWLDFRNVRLTLIAAIPTLLTVASMQGLMIVAGIAFNPLNVMALPVVIGIAVDDGVHMVHRFLREGGDVRRTVAGTGRSVVLTSATTIAAFGTLAFTSHRGLASFALAMTLGVGAAVVLSVLLLPSVLERFGPRRSESRQDLPLATEPLPLSHRSGS